MMKALFIAIYILFSSSAFSQMLLPVVTNSSGSSGTVNNIHFEFNLGESFTTTIGNSQLVTQGLLQPIVLAQGPLPVLGLEFNAKRISNNKVQLNWKTVQEIDNKGFYVERKKESDLNFTQLHFVQSAAPNGNASLPLSYAHVDTNSFAGKTYYRLKQEDIDGRYMYSTIRLVNGNNHQPVVLKAWPVPAVGNFNVQVQGILKQDVLQLFDVHGRLLKTYPVQEQVPINISGLAPGTYFVRLVSDVSIQQKVIVR